MQQGLCQDDVLGEKKQINLKPKQNRRAHVLVPSMERSFVKGASSGIPSEGLAEVAEDWVLHKGSVVRASLPLPAHFSDG